MKNKQLYITIKWLVAITSVIYLAYKLYSYNYPENFWQLLAQSFSANAHYFWLCILLLPFNLSAETLKWKTLTNKTQEIKFSIALQSVLAGFSTGFISPNRIGEFAGRTLHFDKQNRITIAVLSFVSSAIQNFIIAAFGILAFFATSKNFIFNKLEINIQYAYYIFVLIIIALIIYFFIPKITAFLKHEKNKRYLNGIASLKAVDLLQVILYSIIRYIIFCIQFYAMLRFFSINISPIEALWAIPLYYLFVSFTPAMAFGELAVRSSYAIVVLSPFAGDKAPLLALAGFAIWIINFAMPMLMFYITQLKPTIHTK